VLVDFTHLDSAPHLLLDAIKAGVRPVSGTSGLPEDVLSSIDEAARAEGIGAVWAPNFGLGGVLAMHFAQIAARYLDSVEIVEAHHVGKADAPSGTTLQLTRLMEAAHGGNFNDPPVKRQTLAGTRGGVDGGIRVHSLRLPGVLGWHEVIFGGDEELLTIRQESFGRGSYVPAVARAIREVVRPDRVGLIRGYDTVIGLTTDGHAVAG
jgi:4-hydroxy-tetrahydrodipicolinate reductase